jgi:hypothetical protein
VLTPRTAGAGERSSLQGEDANKQARRRGGDEPWVEAGEETGDRKASGFLSVEARRALSSAVQWLLDLVLRLTRAQGLLTAFLHSSRRLRLCLVT